MFKEACVESNPNWGKRIHLADGLRLKIMNIKEIVIRLSATVGSAHRQSDNAQPAAYARLL